jgi:hypothetical protein
LNEFIGYLSYIVIGVSLLAFFFMAYRQKNTNHQSMALSGLFIICMEESAFGIFIHPETYVMLPQYEGTWPCPKAQGARVLLAMATALVPSTITIYLLAKKTKLSSPSAA